MADPVEFVRIKNPKKPGETLVLAKRDFDPAVHRLADDPRETPVPDDLDTTPGTIASVNVNEAKDLIFQADTVQELDKLEADERAGNGRKAVLKAIEHRREDLA